MGGAHELALRVEGDLGHAGQKGLHLLPAQARPGGGHHQGGLGGVPGDHGSVGD